MLSRRSVLFACILVLTAAGASSAYDVTANAPGVGPLYFPLIAHDEPALSEITGLAYSSTSSWMTEDPDREIYTLRADGTGLTRLTENDWQDFQPSWSPDGTLILWNQFDNLSTASEYDDMWLMDSDGSHARDISNLPGGERGEWSPAGNYLYILNYDRNAPVGQEDALYATTPTASAPTLVIGGVNLTDDQWSPAGNYISFVTYSADYVFDLYTAHPDGSNVTLVASDMDQFATWSPDGAWLAYEKESAGNVDIYISRPDASETRPIATTPADERAAGWVEGGARLVVSRVADESPYPIALDLVSTDGTRIPFVASVPGHHVRVQGISPDGTHVVYHDVFEGVDHQLKLQATDSLTPLAISPVISCTLCTINFGGWSYDGRQIAYAFVWIETPHSSSCDLYVANVDGSDPVYQLLDPASCGPHWLPRSSWLSAYGDNGYTLQLFSPRTGATRAMPRSFEDTRLFVEEWRYVP